MDLVQAGQAIAWMVHRRERPRETTHTTMYRDHIKPIVLSVRSVEEKFLAFVHDVPEKAVELANEERVKKSLPLLSRKEEEAVIEANLAQTVSFLQANGHIDMSRSSPLIEDLNVLTKRTSDKGADGYRAYGARIILYARETGRTTVVAVKMADLLNNMDEDRNPGKNAQSTARRIKIALYRELYQDLRREFKNVKLKPFKKNRTNRKEFRSQAFTATGRQYHRDRSGKDGRRFFKPEPS